MAFPDLRVFNPCSPGPYERQMGVMIARLLRAFTGLVPDAESNARVAGLADRPDRWSAAHAVFDAVRARMLAADAAGDAARQRQYGFEETCCKAMYNATDPRDPFDSGQAFFVVPEALALAPTLGLTAADVAAAIWGAG